MSIEKISSLGYPVYEEQYTLGLPWEGYISDKPDLSLDEAVSEGDEGEIETYADLIEYSFDTDGGAPLASEPDELPGLPEEQYIAVDDIYEQRRLRRRGSHNTEDGYMNGSKPAVIGPSCRDLYPFLATDPWEYAFDSPLAELELREIMASTTLAILRDADKYTTIVGEDTSGRIPALIIRQAVNIVRQRQGLAKARGLFVSGRIESFVQPAFRAADENDTALLVTEYVCSGSSVRNAASALERSGFQHVSVATLDRSSSNTEVPAETFYMGDRLSYTGRADRHLTWIDKDLKGVEKDYGLAHSRRYTDGDYARTVRMRADITHFAEEIAALWGLLNDKE